ncbi:hypothetical protein [Ramlibacter algicola]|uniref:Molecular chaperone DnaJ n=1 Tax=Ramlibacter algicola TaxID=2795217 RepID=A0A934Q1W4_9BURK|nr:hypothetical protein [Ramlibacter algicola]MBK0393092.1 hypothetical protein [Ramlibacter algicola]
MAVDHDKTGKFDVNQLRQARCPDCSGSGELRIESENITEDFEVEKQLVITPCTRCGGSGYVAAG